jgi:hypothetical protein
VPLGAPAVYRNIRRWLATIDIPLGAPVQADRPVVPTPAEGLPVAAAAPGSPTGS